MQTTRYILFIALMTLLILPAVQQYTGFIREKPLKGAIVEPEKPKLSTKSWFDASFQEKYDDYLEKGIGFRPTLIRINNQIAFTVFDTALANSVIIGKNNYLYELNYIKAYEGTDFAGNQQIEDQVSKAKFLQDKLESQGKHFLIVFAPGKASFFPEFIPDKYKVGKRGPTNYGYFVKCCQEKGVHFLDFNSWFMSMKNTSQYPLYSRTGIHWSLYGVALAVDSLVKYMEKSAGIDMVDVGWDEIEVTSKPRDTDNDIAEGMNLLFPISSGKLAYPRLKFNSPPGKVKPNVLVVGDSYYWNIMGSGISAELFGDNNFWFYNQEAHNPAWPTSKKVNTLNVLEEIKRQDFVILLSTEANLFKFSFGFLDKVKSAITNPTAFERMTPGQRDSKILEIMEALRNSEESTARIKEKAARKKISFEEMLRLDAEWVFEQKYAKN
jgi:hypothetical protein